MYQGLVYHASSALTMCALFLTGRAESSFINYRVGEGMPELAKLRKEYDSGERNSSDNGWGPAVEIRIPAEHATTNNRQVCTSCSCDCSLRGLSFKAQVNSLIALHGCDFVNFI